MAPDLRFDPLGRRHVLLAPERARRGAPDHPPDEPDPNPCDFCEGQEANTPPESYAIRKHGTAPDSPGWRVRVMPNLYPAADVHEVVVHSPDHDARFETLDHGRRRAVVLAWRERCRAVAGTPIVLMNRGRASGASRSHDHSQIVGLADPPPVVARELASLEAHPCLLCAWAEDDDLVVDMTEPATVVAHPVPLTAGELVVIPRSCSPSLAGVETTDLGPLADALASAVAATQRSMGTGVPFNLVIHSAPAGAKRFHWHAHLYPRTATWGGLEIGAELPVVAADPQETARNAR